MPLMKKIENLLAFIAGGIIAITVGFFMLRGTMRMWDRNKEKSKKLDDSSEKS